jgi:nitrogen regulatory protein PII
MRKIEIVATPTMMDSIKRVLAKTKTATLVSLEARAGGPGVSTPVVYRSTKYMAEVDRMLLRLVVADGAVDDTLRAVCDAAHEFRSGEIDVTVTPVDDVIRIRSTPTGARMN